MLIEAFVRGNGFAWSATFKDVSGDDVEPQTAKLYVSYVDAAGARVTADPIDMEPSTSGTWTAFWDSSAANKGRLYWSIRTTEPSAAAEGSFDLAANLANPDPESSS